LDPLIVGRSNCAYILTHWEPTSAVPRALVLESKFRSECVISCGGKIISAFIRCERIESFLESVPKIRDCSRRGGAQKSFEFGEGHCGDCHTPRNILFGLNNHRKFAGAITQGWKAYNITPDFSWGIGSWSDEQLQGYLSRGHADGRGSAGGPMAEVVDYSLNFLSDADIRAMITYLKSVPSNSDARDDAAAPTPSSQQEVNPTTSEPIPNRGLQVFEGACISCHGLDGKGVVSTYASLLGGRAVNDPAGTNATQALLDGTHLRIAKTVGFMPGFEGGYSDPEIAAVVNYLLGRFGKSAPAVTPDDIAKRRQEN
jgi:mono/diheme cytochrome c family protein